MLGWVALTVLGWSGSIRFFCGDETRLGLKTLGGRKITTRGIKPVGRVQWQFEVTYLYGIVEPKTGASFFFEFSHLLEFRLSRNNPSLNFNAEQGSRNGVLNV